MIKINVHTNCSDIYDALNHDYDIISVGDSVTEMYKSEDKAWNIPREKVITCQEDKQKGGYKFNIDKKKVILDTCKAYELYILLGFLFRNVIEDKIEYRESTMIKTI